MEAKSRRDDTILTLDKLSAVGGDSNRQHQTSTNMTKPLSLKKVLATLLTIVAVFAGQQAFATITSPMSLTGNSALMNGQYYHVWKTEGFLGYYPQPRTQGSSYTFNGQNIGLNRGDVHITGTLNFAESNELSDVTTGSQVTIVFSSDQFWFYGATVKKLDGTNVTGCSASASSDHTSITVTRRTMVGSTCRYSAMPPHTPANFLSLLLLCRRAAAPVCSVSAAPSAPAVSVSGLSSVPCPIRVFFVKYCTRKYPRATPAAIVIIQLIVFSPPVIVPFCPEHVFIIFAGVREYRSGSAN